jgi:hypothetical protein
MMFSEQYTDIAEQEVVSNTDEPIQEYEINTIYHPSGFPTDHEN